MNNEKEIKFKESITKIQVRLLEKDRKLFNEIRYNASKNKENISYNDIEDLKIDIELFSKGVYNDR